MAKLTEEQKASNKVAARARDQAYRARRRLYEATRDAELSNWMESTPLKAEMLEAKSAHDAAREAAVVEEHALLDQIDALRAQIAQLPVKHRLDELNARRVVTSDAYHKELRRIESRVDEQFSDVAHCWSAPEWAAKTGFRYDANAVAG